MKIAKPLNIIGKCVVLTSVFIFSSISAFSAESYLSGIDIKQEANGNYNVMLKVDKKSQIKKSIDSEGNLTLILNSTLPSESMDIVYDNADNLQNVIVQKKNDENTLILLQADNIQNAKIYTSELSTGLVNELNNESSILNNLFFIADKKILASSIMGMILLFMIMLFSRPKETRYTANTAKKHTNLKKHTNVNTLRNKNLIQSQNVPSINYRVNGSFNAGNSHVSKPKDFVINTYNEEKIRKVG